MSTAASPPDDLERLFRRLVTNLADLDPSRLHHPFAVAELYESLVPYRTHRAALGLDSGEDYEMVVLRLLAGERGYATVEPEEARDVLAAEIRAVNPETGLFRHYRDATVRLDPDAVNALLSEDPSDERDQPPAPSVAVPPREETGAGAADRVAEEADEEAEAQLPFVLEEPEDEELARPEARPRRESGGAPCQYCGGALPMGRTVLFCPHCGQNVGVVHCPTCGSELDVGWRFCITCGQKFTGLG